MKTTRTLSFAALTVLLSLLTLGGCNTMKGVGQDLEAAGDAIQDEAEEKKPY